MNANANQDPASTHETPEQLDAKLNHNREWGFAGYDEPRYDEFDGFAEPPGGNTDCD